MADQLEDNEKTTTTEEPRDVSQAASSRSTDASWPPSSVHALRESSSAKKSAGRLRLQFLGGALLLIVSASAGFAGGWFGSRGESNSQTIQKQQIVLKNQGQLISSIASQVSPSVVSVEVTSTGRAPSTYGGLFGGYTQEPQTQQSAGTGIIIDKNGMIITNRHVVPAGTTQVSVTLSDGTKYDNVQVIGRTSDSDPLDIAFLKIGDTRGKTLTPATLGDSSAVGIGDSVIAIGNALGQFQNTVTSGIISGHGRSVQAGDQSGSNTENLEDLFQTDAAINEGNSGGPLVNLEGQVIGINVATAGNAQNIGFSIPINDIKGAINSVLTTGKLQRPYLGVQYIPITADMAKQYNLGATQGVYIPPSVMIGTDSIIKGGPADKAGVKEGDIITKVDNDNIDASHSLTSLLDKHSVGDKVQLTIVRSGKNMTIDVTLGSAPQS